MTPPLNGVRCHTFRGLQTNRDPREIDPGGAQDQLNVATNVPGKLAVRGGVQPYTFAATQTLKTGWNTFRRACFCRARNGDLFIVNGSDKPLRWDGVTSAAEDAGMPAPETAPEIAADSGGGATEGNYDFYYRFLDDTLPEPVPSSLSPVATVAALDDQRFDWTVPDAAPYPRATQIELWRTTSYSGSAHPNTIYRVATLAIDDGAYSDTASDATLLAFDDEDVAKILLEDGSLNMNRFTPPPADRAVMVMFQDRYWYAVTPKYNQGVDENDEDVTGVGYIVSANEFQGFETDWNNQMVGRYLLVEGEPTAYEILSVTFNVFNQVLTIDGTFAQSAGPTRKPYVIQVLGASNAESPRRRVLYSEVDEPESCPKTNVVTIQENTGDDDDITGLIPRGSYLFVMTDRHRYALSFARQPRIDANVSLVDDRGLVNQWCWSAFDDVIFCLDDAGPYLFRGAGRAEPIDPAIHDYWREGTVDQTKRERFHVVVDRKQERVYYFVCFVGDAAEFPTRALVYNVRTATWDLFAYSQQQAAAAIARREGEMRLFLASENQTVHLADSGTTDVVAAETRGTASGGSASTLADASANFTDAMLGAWVYLRAGTGKGQRRKIASRTPTELTVDPDWETAPDATTGYVVGAIPWLWKSGRFPLVHSDLHNERSVRLMFPPRSGDYRLDLRLYWNYDDAPEEYEPTSNVQGNDAPRVDADHPQDVVISLQSSESPLEDKVGYEQWRFSGRLVDRAHTDRMLAVELRGFQGDEAIEIDEVDVIGVADPTQEKTEDA